ncbi:hypothetical protein SISSUDRAFT_981147 [Sistotremastrum suecicum HHB10207 ss-3]|uniref:BTB domain-containing protein n=1 Tax=Sistotremastrum suecicum HHB10207 ss-3 TaxID=1314776 RepID=A0A166GSH1_9AGAM|nr:hypothetical protein SISSUDRAFT_981147 [Sistotremastrum suecicum HHB10207 ss-3]
MRLILRDLGKVQNTLFCVHRHFFLKHSTAFTDALEFPQLVGSSPSMPCRLVRVTVEEFECLLDYFYECILSVDDIPIGKWVLLLRAATSYSFTRPREIAMRIIQSKFSIIPLVDRIILAEQCGITEWLESSWEEFIRRNEPMSLEEGMRFGMETVIKVAAAREAQKLRRVSEAGEILADVMAIRARMVSPQPPAIRSRTASISMQSTQL